MARIRITIEIDTDGDDNTVVVRTSGSAEDVTVDVDEGGPRAFSAGGPAAPPSSATGSATSSATPTAVVAAISAEGLMGAIGIHEDQPLAFGGADPAEARRVMEAAAAALRKDARTEADLAALSAGLQYLEDLGDAEAIERVTRYVLGEPEEPEDDEPLAFAVKPLKDEELQRARMLGVPAPEDFRDPPRGWYKSKDAAARGLRKVFEAEERAGAPNAELGNPSLDTWFSYVGGSDVPGHPPEPPTYDVERPESLSQLRAALGKAGVRHCRVVGGGHDSSTIAYPPPGELLLSLHGLEDLDLAPGVAGSTPQGAPTFVREDAPSWGDDWRRARVPAGISVQRVKAKYLTSLMFDQLGGYDQQTLWGAVCTGTHGSGMGQGPLCDYICSVDMMIVQPDGQGGRRVRPVRIEAADGPTDAAAFRADPKLADWLLVQDDAFFDAVRVSFGCMGVVFALTVWTRLRYGLRETRLRDRISPTGLQAEIRREFRDFEGNQEHGGPVSAGRFQLEYVVNTYQSDDGKHGIVRNKRTVIPYTEQLEGRRDQPKLLKNQKKAGPSAVAGRVWKFSGLLGPQAFQSVALDNTAHKDPIEFRGQDALYLGVGRWATAPASEVAFPAARVEDALNNLDRRLRRLHQGQGSYRLTSPPGLRFVRPSKALLAPQFGSPAGDIDVWAMIECASPLYLPGQEEVLSVCEHVLVDLGGRPHWGQTHAVGSTHLDHWPAANVETWLSVLERLDPLAFFDNAFTDKIGIRRRSREVEPRPFPGGGAPVA